jgi:hypothetical protein
MKSFGMAFLWARARAHINTDLDHAGLYKTEALRNATALNTRSKHAMSMAR